jgi:uncharacterized protein YjiK
MWWRSILTKIWIIPIPVLLTDCTGNDLRPNTIEESPKSRYSFKQPDVVYILPEPLREVSGISWHKDHSLACIQDERGVVYYFDTRENCITNSVEFAENNDYEDIVVSGDTIWVLRSDGDLYRIDLLGPNKINLRHYPTNLMVRNNSEGLALDVRNNSLLIACKGEPFLDENDSMNGMNAIYRFDITKRKLDEKPVFLIDVKMISTKYRHHFFRSLSIRVAHSMHILKHPESFYPSGIAIHPLTLDLYIISARHRMLLVTNPTGQVISTYKLNDTLFNQPEGICFAPNGTLFIANEGGKSEGNILQFNQVSQ